MVGNDLWNSIRVKNFVKGLGKKPTKWTENIAFIAECANITVGEFLQTDPITVGIWLWGEDRRYPGSPNPILQKIMGYSPYSECMQLHAMVAYHKNAATAAAEAVPPVATAPILWDAATIKSELDDIVKAVVAADQPPTEWRCECCTALWRTVV